MKNKVEIAKQAIISGLQDRSIFDSLTDNITTADLQNYLATKHNLNLQLPTMRRVVRALVQERLVTSAGRQGLKFLPNRLIALVVSTIDDYYVGPVLKGLLREATAQ